MSNTLDLCKNAASIAVDSVFNNVLAKLSGGSSSNNNNIGTSKMLHLEDSSSPNNNNSLSSKSPNKHSPKYNPLHADSLSLPNDLRGPTVQWAIEEEKSQFEKEEENIMRQKAKRTADRYSKTTDLLRRAKLLEEQMKQKGGDVQGLDADGNVINADGIDFPSMTQTQIQDQLNVENNNNNNNNQDQVNLIKQLQVTDSEVFGGLLAKGGRRSIEEAGFTSPEELDANMRKHKDAQRRLRRKRIELEKKKQQRLMAEKAEQEMLRRNIEKNEERRKRMQEEHEAERKRLLADRVMAQKRERQKRKEEREQLLKNEAKLKKIKKKPLYKRMEDEYNERILMPELIRRKQKLAAIHKRFKESSPALSDIDMHQRAIQAQERLNRERSRLKRRGREKVWNQSKTYYTGKSKMSILEEQRSFKSKEQLRLREKKLIRAKQKAYGEFVRKQVAPKVDPDKIDEVKERISKLKHPAPLRKELREKEALNAVVRMEPQRPNGNNNYNSVRVKQELQQEILKEQERLEQPSHRMRSRNDALETARFLNAKEQAKEDMRLRRERRRQKQLQQRGVGDRNNNDNHSKKKKRTQQQQQQQQQQSNSFELPSGEDQYDGKYDDGSYDDGNYDDDTKMTSGRIIEDAEQHAKLSNMYMQAMQAKMQELQQLEED